MDHVLEKDNVRVIALDLVHENYKAAIVQASKTLCASFIEKQKRRGIKPRLYRLPWCVGFLMLASQL